jgi:beta-lactamase superfamily II metal-dependent hydrolase
MKGLAMKLRALTRYNSDTDTRFGDCILLYDNSMLIVYDCGHAKHSEAVQSFLIGKTPITQVHVVVSHNDSDHASGVVGLLDWLAAHSKYTVKVYTHQYLKHVDTILNKIDDGRRNRESLKRSLLAEFDSIKVIIEAAQKHGFAAIEALKDATVGTARIVGPTVGEFTDVAAQAVDSRLNNNIGEGHAEETVMNAASIQLKCDLDTTGAILLCGDASPDYLHNIDIYDVIQLPHHGQLDDAKAVFGKLKDAYRKDYLISDNTGSGNTSGGSDDLVKYMEDEYYSPAKNTKNGTVEMPVIGLGGIVVPPPSKPKGVKLCDMGFRL